MHHLSPSFGWVLIIALLWIISLALMFSGDSGAIPVPQRPASCDRILDGYQCDPAVSHLWGQYSPYYSVPSSISADLPEQCHLSFVQVLSRHGGRYPTSSKTALYNATIAKIKTKVSTSSLIGNYAFLADYEYTLGADQLTVFGQQQMINSGAKFYERYHHLTKTNTPFVRSASGARVVESALNFTQGFHAAKQAAGAVDGAYPYPIVVISEDAGSNNTLNHDICAAFEDDPFYGTIASIAQDNFLVTFITPILARLNKVLPGANFTSSDVIYMMDLCPFNTVASPTGVMSPFCALFTHSEWVAYDYYETLGKYYGYGAGNPLGPTQGVGWTNELIARLTDKPVNDHTSTNRTLDSSPLTFPLGKTVYADFSHDNDMTSIFYALGLYNSTPTLNTNMPMTPAQTKEYTASWTVPFAARAYFEKMMCAGASEELVRVIVNDHVLPLSKCEADDLGRCTLSKFVGSLTFAREDGLWDQCFPSA